MDSKKNFLKYVILPIFTFFSILCIVLYFTIKKIKDDNLKTYKHTVIQRLHQYVEDNFLGINTLSITTRYVDNKEQMKDVKTIFDMITSNNRYPYMAVLDRGKVVVESIFGDGVGKHINEGVWKPINLLNTPNSYFRFVLTENMRFYVELKKQRGNIQTVATIDLVPLFLMITTPPFGGDVMLRVQLGTTTIFENDGFFKKFNNFRIRTVNFNDPDSGLKFTAQFDLVSVFNTNSIIYFLSFICFFFFMIIVLYKNYRSMEYLSSVIKKSGDLNEKDNLDKIYLSIKKDLFVNGLTKNITNILNEKDRQIHRIFSSSLNCFHTMKNISDQTIIIIKNDTNIKIEIKKELTDLFKDTKISRKIEENDVLKTFFEKLSSLTINTLDCRKDLNKNMLRLCELANLGESGAIKAIYSRNSKTDIIDFGWSMFQFLNDLYVDKSISIKTNKDSMRRFGIYAAISENDVILIRDNLVENAQKELSTIPSSHVKKMSISVTHEEGLHCLSVGNTISPDRSYDSVLGLIKAKISNTNDRTTTREHSYGQGIRTIVDLTVNSGGKIFEPYYDNSMLFFKVGFLMERHPYWISEEIKSFLDEIIVIVDDDEYFCTKMKEKLFSYGVRSIETYTNPKDGLSRVLYLFSTSRPFQFFCDNLFGQNQKTGIEMIVENNLFKQSTLITSKISLVENDCKKNRIKCMSKQGFLSKLEYGFPVHVIERSKIKIISIDDDPMSVFQDQILECKRFDEFIRVCRDFDKTIVIFMDYVLNEDDMAFNDRIRWLLDNGYRNVYLHSGNIDLLKNQYRGEFQVITDKSNLYKEFKEILQ